MSTRLRRPVPPSLQGHAFARAEGFEVTEAPTDAETNVVSSLTTAGRTGCERCVVPGADAPLSGGTLCREAIGPWTVAPGSEWVYGKAWTWFGLGLLE